MTFPAFPRVSLFLAASLLVTPAALGQQTLEVVEPEQVGMSSDRLSKLTREFEDYVEDGDLAGAVILVGRNGQIPYFETFGQRDIKGGAAMTEDTIFRIASQTKAIVSVAVMMLLEDGELLISEPVGKYLPEFMETTVAVPVADGAYAVVPAERHITIRDLLTHTSGISYGEGPAADLWAEAGFQGWYFGHFEEPIRELVRHMAELPADAQPGSAWIYGYNIDILGALVEEVSGKPLDQFLQENVKLLAITTPSAGIFASNSDPC